MSGSSSSRATAYRVPRCRPSPWLFGTHIRFARNLLIEVEHPVWGTVREVATASRAGEPREHHTRAPELGEHNESVLTELCGYDESERRALELAGAFGPGGY